MRSKISDWVRKEALQQKLLGLKYWQIADRITLAARGETPSAVPTSGLEFPPNFKISVPAVFKAIKQGLDRPMTLTREELKELDNLRSEECILALQKGIHEGDAKSVHVEKLLLDHMASVNGYCAATKLQVTAEVSVAKKAEVNVEEDDTDRFPIEMMRELTEDEHEVVFEIMGNARKRWLAKVAAAQAQAQAQAAILITEQGSAPKAIEDGRGSLT
jgi:hypothetical protein